MFCQNIWGNTRTVRVSFSRKKTKDSCTIVATSTNKMYRHRCFKIELTNLLFDHKTTWI